MFKTLDQWEEFRKTKERNERKQIANGIAVICFYELCNSFHDINFFGFI
jgi:hypothetical protein